MFLFQQSNCLFVCLLQGHIQPFQNEGAAKEMRVTGGDGGDDWDSKCWLSIDPVQSVVSWG